MPGLVIGVTSHRNLVAGEVDGLRARVRDFLRRLREQYPELPLTVVSALAAGGDQLVAEEALELGCRLIAPLPLPRGDYERDFDTVADRERFARLCDRATVIVVGPEPDAPATGGERSRDWHYARAGVYVASHCHLLLAIWDGRSAVRPGGTAQVVDYYLTGRKPSPIGHRHATDGFGVFDAHAPRLAWHLVCSRDETGGAPQAPFVPLRSRWFTGAAEWPGENPMPPLFAATFARIAAFHDDAAGLERRASPAVEPAPESAASGDLFAAADALARHYRRRSVLALRATHVIAALMGFAFVLYDNLDQKLMIFGFLLLFALGVVLDRIGRSREWHRKYLDYRALAEGLRVQWYWHRAGMSTLDEAEFAHGGFLRGQDPELDWVRHVMRARGLELASMPPDEADPRSVADEWIGDEQRGQLHYYARGAAMRGRHHQHTEQIGEWTLWVSMAISVFLAVFVFHLSPDVRSMLVAAMAVLSITAAVREAYAWRKADRELIRQYRLMLGLFRRAREALDRAVDVAEQREILRALGEMALAEHAEWALRHRERPLERARV